MPDERLTHNVSNAVTADIWRRDAIVHKRLTRSGTGPDHWLSSEEPHHWNYWKREALVYSSGLPGKLGLRAPRLLDLIETADGDLELQLEHLSGPTGAELTVTDLVQAAGALGRAQGRPQLPSEPWLSHRFLRTYSGTKPVNGKLLDQEQAWAQPLIRAHFGDSLRASLIGLHRNRERLLRVMEQLPRTICHLDVWPHNLIGTGDGDVAFVDWAFVGDGALGEDIGNLVPDAVFDRLFPAEQLDELDHCLTSAYTDGLRDAGWHGDERVVRLGICAAAVKYDWLTAVALEGASDVVHLDYGHRQAVDANSRYAARAAGLELCGRWSREAEQLAVALGYAW